MAEPSVTRGKSFEQIMSQRERLFMRALDNGDYERADRIDEIGSRYLRNIAASTRYRNARARFDREGADLAFREQERARGRNNFAEMYQVPYSQRDYMRNRRNNRNV